MVKKLYRGETSYYTIGLDNKTSYFIMHHDFKSPILN